MTLDIDRVLRSDAEQWQASMPTGFDLHDAPLDVSTSRNGTRRSLLATVAVSVAILVTVGVVLGHRPDPAPKPGSVASGPTPSVSQSSGQSGQLTPSQRSLALKLAHEMAVGSNGDPVVHNPVPDTWPDNVTHVSVLLTTAADGAQYIDGNTAFSGPALVIRLIGTFTVVTTGPNNANVTGNQITALVPLSVGDSTDSSIETSTPPVDLPDSTILYSR